MNDFIRPFLFGLVIGISIAAPVGPIGILCIRRTLAQGKWAGFISGLGAATADATYGALAALGISFVTNVIVSLQDWTRVIGGVFLIFVGFKTFFSPATTVSFSTSVKDYVGNFLSTFLLTITNPMTILFFAAIFSGLSLAKLTAQSGSYLCVIAGVFTGSALWWLVLSQTASLIKVWHNQKVLVWVNRISGLIILGFGVISLVSTGLKYVGIFMYE